MNFRAAAAAASDMMSGWFGWEKEKWKSEKNLHEKKSGSVATCIIARHVRKR